MTSVLCGAGATLKLQWLSRPSTVLVVAKPTPRVQGALLQVVTWLLNRRMRVMLEPQVHLPFFPPSPPNFLHLSMHARVFAGISCFAGSPHISAASS